MRPFTEEAADLLKRSKDAVHQLRDGDWKVKETAAGASSEASVKEDKREADSPANDTKEAEVEEEEEDFRLEGTAAYLPPEVVQGRRPTTAADCWALGCVLYFCLAGRPPVWAETEAEVSGSSSRGWR